MGKSQTHSTRGVVRKKETARKLIYWTVGLSFTALAILAAVKCSQSHAGLNTAENNLDAANDGHDAASSTFQNLTRQLARAEQDLLDANCSMAEFPAYKAAVEAGSCVNITDSSLPAVERLEAAGYALDLPPADKVLHETTIYTEYECVAWNGLGWCVEHGNVEHTGELLVTEDYQGPFWVSGSSVVSAGLCGDYARNFSSATYNSTVTGQQTKISVGHYARTDKVYSSLELAYKGPSAGRSKFLLPHSSGVVTRDEVASAVVPYFVKLCQAVFSDANSYGVAHFASLMRTLANDTIPGLMHEVSVAKTNLSVWSGYVSGNGTVRDAAEVAYDNSLQTYLWPLLLVPLGFGFLGVCAVKYSEYKESQRDDQRGLTTA